MADSPTMDQVMTEKRFFFMFQLTQEASHLCKPDAILDGPGPGVPVVVVLGVPPLGQEQHWVSVLLAGQPESIVVDKPYH